jgi:predicted metalloenzyme YecM
MFSSYDEFIAASSPYLEYCSAFIALHKLEDEVTADHICYKCCSAEEYDQLRALLEVYPPAKYFYQVNLSKRRVAYIGLEQSIPLRTGAIKFIELADKKGNEEVCGFHHVELYPLHMSYESLVKHLEERGEKPELKERPHHTTYDITLSNGFIIRLTNQPLIKKIAEEELLRF